MILNRDWHWGAISHKIGKSWCWNHGQNNKIEILHIYGCYRRWHKKTPCNWSLLKDKTTKVGLQTKIEYFQKKVDVRCKFIFIVFNYFLNDVLFFFLTHCPGLYAPSSVFEPCHTVISPGQYVESCQSDICNGGNDTCSSLEAYATECSNAGVCIDWRNATNGQCGKI